MNPIKDHLDNVNNFDYPVFNYVKTLFGGTEMMARYFHNNIYENVTNMKDYLCLIIPGTTPKLEEMINGNKEIILWMHNFVHQFAGENIEFLASEPFLKKVKYIIVASEYQKQETAKILNISLDKIVVINNGIPIFEYNKEKFNKVDKVKIIHTSSPDRGLWTLLNSLKYIEEDFDLEIYNNFYPDTIINDPELESLCEDPRITFFGKTPKKIVDEALANTHIFAYPAEYVETFCLSLAEAISAGCLPVYTNFGALPEVSNGCGIMYDKPFQNINHDKVFAENLTKAIKMIKNNEWDPSEQIKLINSKYSFEQMTKQWLNFDKSIQEKRS